MTPLALAMLLASAEPQDAVFTPATPPRLETARDRKARERAEAREKIECREVTPTGSNLPQTACFPVREWERMREEGLEFVRSVDSPSMSGQPSAPARGR